MSTDLPVSESGKSGPARSFDFEIETKKNEKTVKVVKEKKERKPRKAKERRPKERGPRERRPKERRPKERRPKERRPKEVGEADERLHAVAQRQPTQGGVGHKGSGAEEAVRNRKAGVKKKDVGLSWTPLGPRLKL
ncbi:hypothetical protein CesoFtcFv8_015198 [Champsocephalus esox]|uniref:Uncharacterized protein n=1 Tax=Champsocephalus esox TaxID=159716 RepID=A0AAN8BPQ0_9TELE|nr:hypothetical protein CesoFtcFv8_015198 [Champsocephalus esox]